MGKSSSIIWKTEGVCARGLHAEFFFIIWDCFFLQQIIPMQFVQIACSGRLTFSCLSRYSLTIQLEHISLAYVSFEIISLLRSLHLSKVKHFNVATFIRRWPQSLNILKYLHNESPLLASFFPSWKGLTSIIYSFWRYTDIISRSWLKAASSQNLKSFEKLFQKDCHWSQLKCSKKILEIPRSSINFYLLYIERFDNVSEL